MNTIDSTIAYFQTPACGETFEMLYGHAAGVKAEQAKRYEKLVRRFAEHFPAQTNVRIFSAPGRAEIGGNHTDHQSGCVLAASVNLDTVAAAATNGEGIIRIESEGYPRIEVKLDTLFARDDERGTSAAVVRGCAARMQALGHAIGGFDAAVTSSVLGGSGLSSSAAFEVMLCRVLDGLYGKGDLGAKTYATVSQYAENEYFGKPSGLLDQMGSAVGGLAAMDFLKPEPAVEAIAFDFEAHGYTLAVVATGGSHDDLTHCYAAIPAEMREVAEHFGKERLRFVDPAAFDKALPQLFGKVSDRAILRAMHFFAENARVAEQVEALKQADLPRFFALVNASGDSSMRLLQNIYDNPQDQSLTLALELSRQMLSGTGAFRIHGGGFAGTILAFVPLDAYAVYSERMDQVFGKGATQPLNIRPVGAYELEIKA